MTMKAINIIGLLLIVLTSTVGNRIAPGRYCTFSENDTVRAFGQTKVAENDKHGFWVYLDRWGGKNNLGFVINYKDNKRDGWYVSFAGDSVQNKSSEIHFRNDVVDGTVRFYNMRGQCNEVLEYKDGEMVRDHYLIYEDFDEICFKDPLNPPQLDSAKMDMLIAGLVDEIDLFPTDDFSPDKEKDKIIVFNSWTNNITAINVVICCVLLVLNVVSIVKKRK